MTLRIDDELELALSELAAAEGTSRQEVVKRAVIDRRDRMTHREKIERCTNEFMVEYADVLRRLAERE
jgi:predicted transcriptional regulator